MIPNALSWLTFLPLIGGVLVLFTRKDEGYVYHDTRGEVQYEFGFPADVFEDLVPVKFLGRITPEELSRYYRHAKALVVPSVCFETFGIILIEAFRQGTPVIARRIGPFPEIVERSGGGMLFTDANDLTKALERLENEAGLRDALARAGRSAFVRNWSEEAVVPQYLLP